MSGYGDIKSKKLKKVLRWLENTRAITVTAGGRHTKVTCIHTGRGYPLPLSHPVINKHIVKDFAEWLAANDICTEEEFRNRF